MTNKQNQTIIVLGMHRSGTSCLTGLLQQAGLVLGDVVKEAPFNKKGNRENLEIRALNDAVLAFNDAAWDSPPTAELSWNQEHRAMRDAIIQRYATAAAWGFKDPRTTLTLPFWLEGLPAERVRFIATLRHPLLVAKSLHARQPDLAMEQGLALWRDYNENLLAYHQQYHFPILDFDLDPEPYLQAFQAAAHSLRIQSLSPSQQLDFFDESLRHRTPRLSELDQYAQVLLPLIPLHKKLLSLT